MADTTPAEDMRVHLIESAALRIAGGFRSPEEILESLIEQFEYEDPPIEEDEVREVVTPMIAARRAEEATWPERADADRLVDAFSALRAQGVTSEEDFACCMRCGLSEIGGKAAEGSPGYVFFHEQDTERAAAGGGLMLAYGAFGGDEERSLAIGGQVTEALRAEGLGVVWDGSVESRIAVTPLDWRRRMPED